MTDFTDKEDVSKALGKVKDHISELETEILILVGRLYNEDENTFAPETRAVMAKWRPIFKKKYLKL